MAVKIIDDGFDQLDLFSRNFSLIPANDFLGSSDPAPHEFNFRPAIEHMGIIVIGPLLFVAEHFIGFIDPEHPFLCRLPFMVRDDILMIFFDKFPPGILYFLQERVFRNT